MRSVAPGRRPGRASAARVRTSPRRRSISQPPWPSTRSRRSRPRCSCSSTPMRPDAPRREVRRDRRHRPRRALHDTPRPARDHLPRPRAHAGLASRRSPLDRRGGSALRRRGRHLGPPSPRHVRLRRALRLDRRRHGLRPRGTAARGAPAARRPGAVAGLRARCGATRLRSRVRVDRARRDHARGFVEARMKLAAITRLRTTTRLTYEAAGTIRERLARSETEVEGWEEHDGTGVVWEVLRREKGYGVTQASIATAPARALREAEALDLENEDLAARVAILNAIYDTAGDVLDVLAAFREAARGDPDEVADLVDAAASGDEVRREVRFQLALIDAAAAVRATLDAAVAVIAEAVGAQDLDRDEAEEAIRAMAFEDEP